MGKSGGRIVAKVCDVIPSVSEGPGGAGGAQKNLQGAPQPTRSLAHARDDGERVLATPVEGFRNWERDSPREDGGAPGGFDSLAATYLLQHGLSMRGLADVFR